MDRRPDLIIFAASDPGCENFARYDYTQNFEICGHVERKKM